MPNIRKKLLKENEWMIDEPIKMPDGSFSHFGNTGYKAKKEAPDECARHQLFLILVKRYSTVYFFDGFGLGHPGFCWCTAKKATISSVKRIGFLIASFPASTMPSFSVPSCDK